MKVYVASSWRNPRQPEVVLALAHAGHEVYDFRAPNGPGGTPGGFQWSEIDPDWKAWSPETFRERIDHPIASVGFDRDFDAMDSCDAGVLVMPCGRSAHLELGWLAGQGKQTVILLSDGEPELMYRLASQLCVTIDEVLKALEEPW